MHIEYISVCCFFRVLAIKSRNFYKGDTKPFHEKSMRRKYLECINIWSIDYKFGNRIEKDQNFELS